jgi:phosphoribosylaminoimidazole carboxylase (NCAIR synthetase)
MKQVCILGNGQLGRMLRQAGEPLSIAVARGAGCGPGSRAVRPERDYR